MWPGARAQNQTPESEVRAGQHEPAPPTGTGGIDIGCFQKNCVKIAGKLWKLRFCGILTFGYLNLCGTSAEAGYLGASVEKKGGKYFTG